MEGVFSERLLQARRARNLSQRAAATLIGIQAASLSSYESGRNSPNLEIASKISAAYGCSLDWLCGLTEKDNAAADQKKDYTRADVFRTFTTMCEYPLPVSVEGAYGGETLSAATMFGVDLRISNCYWLFLLLDTYKKLLELYKTGEIASEVLEAWKDKKLAELQGLPLCDATQADDELPF